MIFAVTRELFERLKATGELENICNEIEIRARDKVTLTERSDAANLFRPKTRTSCLAVRVIVATCLIAMATK